MFNQNNNKSQEGSTKSNENSEILICYYSGKGRLFNIFRKRDKSELKGEKEQRKTLYKCPKCEKCYTNVTRYEVHLRTHTGEKPFSCSICGKGFNEKGNLKVHLRIHTNERPFECKYFNCGARFKTKGQLTDHEFRHLEIKPFPCPLCHHAFSRKHRLKVHMLIHSGEKPFKCTECKAEFREKGSLNCHMKKIHQGQKELPSPEKKEDLINETLDEKKIEENASPKNENISRKERKEIFFDFSGMIGEKAFPLFCKNEDKKELNNELKSETNQRFINNPFLNIGNAENLFHCPKMQNPSKENKTEINRTDNAPSFQMDLFDSFNWEHRFNSNFGNEGFSHMNDYPFGYLSDNINMDNI